MPTKPKYGELLRSLKEYRQNTDFPRADLKAVTNNAKTSDRPKESAKMNNVVQLLAPLSSNHGDKHNDGNT